jgi:hypothetical protein
VSEKARFDANSAKWAAKSAEFDYKQKVGQAETQIREVEAALDLKPHEVKAARIIAQLVKFVDKSQEITSLQVEIDGENAEPDDQGTEMTPSGRKRKFQ